MISGAYSRVRTQPSLYPIYLSLESFIFLFQLGSRVWERHTRFSWQTQIALPVSELSSSECVCVCVNSSSDFHTLGANDKNNDKRQQ